MKRAIALFFLLAAAGVFLKLAWKDGAQREVRAAREDQVQRPNATAVASQTPTGEDLDAAIRARYPGHTELVDRVLADYHHNAIAIERTDGLRGLVILDRLGLEAVFLYEKYPQEFRRLRDSMGDDLAAADLLLHWREYFALKRSDHADRSVLVSEIASLSRDQRRLAASYPAALPLILTEPVGTVAVFDQFRDNADDLRDALAMLDLISLEAGSCDLRAALRVFEAHGPLALDAFRAQGPEGFALVKMYGPLIEAVGPSVALDDLLIVLRTNTDTVGDLLKSQSTERLAAHLRHAESAGLLEAVAGSPDGLRLLVQHGPMGERALKQAGADAAHVVYGEFANDATLQSQAVAALAAHGPMSVAILAKYGHDKEFRAILQRYGPRVIEPVARADASPEALAALRAKPDRTLTESVAQAVLAVSSESGQTAIRSIRNEGLERVESLQDGTVEFYQFLPLYDLVHLGRVLTSGYSPTTGEMAWAAIDAAFVVADVLSLTALQPAGVAASEIARSEVKGAVRTTAKAAGRELGEESLSVGQRAAARELSSAALERVSRWWTVRLAGGPFRVLKQMPEALAQMSLHDLSRASRPLCERAGLRLSTWAPKRFVRQGMALVQAIPPERGLKYLGVQAVQASVGVVAMHKMEEHLASRRPAAQ